MTIWCAAQISEHEGTYHREVYPFATEAEARTHIALHPPAHPALSWQLWRGEWGLAFEWVGP